MTGRHQDPLGWLQSAVSTTHVIFFIVECGIAHFLCAMRALEVRATSSSLRLPLCQISFLSRPPLLSYSPWRKIAYSINHPFTYHPAYLMPREPKLSLWDNKSAQSNLGRGLHRGAVAHVRRKVPIGYNGAPQIRPQKYPFPWTDPQTHVCL